LDGLDECKEVRDAAILSPIPAPADAWCIYLYFIICSNFVLALWSPFKALRRFFVMTIMQSSRLLMIFVLSFRTLISFSVLSILFKWFYAFNSSPQYCSTF
jgi:hypothetical protein